MLHHRHEETNYCICSFIISTLLFLTNRIYNLPFDTSRNRAHGNTYAKLGKGSGKYSFHYFLMFIHK